MPVDSPQPSTASREPARIALSPGGDALFDVRAMGEAYDAGWFDPVHWQQAGNAQSEQRGRGTVHFVRGPFGDAVLRHYRRGGVIARFNRDRYLWRSAERTRGFREFRLLAKAHAAGLPVPQPLATRFVRDRGWYRADILVRAIPGTHTLADALAYAAGAIPWAVVGATIGRIHRADVFHADLNAHNVLLTAAGEVFLVDFDRGELRAARSGWQRANLQRLHRSLVKLGARARVAGFEADAWPALLAAHRSAAQ